MFNSLRVFFDFYLIINFFLSLTHSQIPPVACPEYFHYSHDGVYFYGKLTIPNPGANSTVVNLQFSQQTPLQSNYQGTLSIYEDEDTQMYNSNNGNKIVYRVTFPPARVIPKLTLIEVNAKVICSASKYPSPSTTLQLQHTLQTALRYTSDTFNDLNKQVASQATQSQPQSISLQLNSINSICGIGAPDILLKIYTTSTSKSTIVPAEFPWLTAIFGKQSTGLGLICGGSLISSRTVLTAAHCMNISRLTADRIEVFLGRFNLTNPFENTFVQRDISSVIIHPEYTTGIGFADADVALLQMVTSVSFTPLVGPICLWSEPDDVSLIVGKRGVVAGWGSDETTNRIRNIPKKAEANIASDVQCLRSSPGFTALTSARTICAGNRDGSGPCLGDSGSGLMIQVKDRWVLRGVVSAGMLEENRCNLNEFVVYCDIAKHLMWIQSNMLP